MQLGRTALIHFASQVLKSVAGFVATLYIARTLGSGALGIYAVVTAMIAWGTVPSQAVNRAVEKRMSEGVDANAFFGAGLTINVVFAVIVGIGIFVFREPVNQFIGVQAAYILPGLFVASTLYWTVLGGLRGEKRVAQAGFAQVLNQSSRTIAQILLIFAGLRIGGVLLGHGVSLLIAALAGLLWSGTRPILPNADQLRSVYEFARYSWLDFVQNHALSSLDVIVLAVFVSSSLVGIYQVAWTLASMLFLFSLSIRATLFPEMSDLSSAADYNRVRHLLDEALTFTGVFMIPGLFGAAVLGPRVLRIYGPEFTEGATVLLVLILARLLAAFGDQFRNVLDAIDRPDVTLRINAIFVVCNLVLNLILVYAFGWYGAAVATAISAALSLLLGFVALRQVLGDLSIPVRELGVELFASVIMALVVAVFVRIAPSSNTATVVLVLLGAGIYGILITVLSERIRKKGFTLLPVDFT